MYIFRILPLARGIGRCSGRVGIYLFLYVFLNIFQDSNSSESKWNFSWALENIRNGINFYHGDVLETSRTRLYGPPGNTAPPSEEPSAPPINPIMGTQVNSTREPPGARQNCVRVFSRGSGRLRSARQGIGRSSGRRVVGRGGQTA